MPGLRKVFEIRAQWDGEAGVWWCSNDELPLTTEAPTFEQLVARVLEIAPEIAAENGLAAPGDEIELHVFAERVQSVPVGIVSRHTANGVLEQAGLPKAF